MSEPDEIATINERHWERMVKAGCGFTCPWLNLDGVLVREFAGGRLEPVPEPLITMYPAGVFADVDGKDVLCLASGGGQQSAVFGLLARVTVVDLTEGQLDGDRTAAAHYGYEVTTIRADMRDLSCIGDESFDVVYQAPSMGYVPDVRQVYSEVARVLSTGGLYRADAGNPAAQFVDTDSWDGQGYRITVPYAVRRVENDGDGPAEFRHYLGDTFNGLLAAGMSVQEVHDDPCNLRHDAQARPGSWEHVLMYVPWSFAIVARKT